MTQTHAVGIDLGTTYSSIAWLNEHGQPVTIPNQEGELSTPSVVFLDGDEFVVGTEALRNAIAQPARVVQNAKRFMGSHKCWKIGEHRLNPTGLSTRIIRKLLDAASNDVGTVSEAVITVPAQFSDAARHATVQAGHAAGLKKVEIINEPIAAALCHVLGSEGLAFTELALDQQLMIFDLGGGTLDLAIVSYTNDQVRVVASGGDLELGGLDWTSVLVDLAAERFAAEFNDDPRRNPESHQALMLEAEQAKRSLSVRPRAIITIQHDGERKSYQIDRDVFEVRAEKLVRSSEAIVRRLLKDNNFGWAHIDALLTTGGASRMPMIRERLQKISGRTLNTSLSPDQSIAHGAAYYAGMLLSNSEFARTIFNSQASARLARIRQQPVNSRSLGIMIRDEVTGDRHPHWLIPENSPLPISKTHTFGTVVDSQMSVRVRIVESGAGPDKPHTELGDCEITGLPPGLPEGSQVDVTISYDNQARVHVAARELTTHRSTEFEIIRPENFVPVEGRSMPQIPIAPKPAASRKSARAEKRESKPEPQPKGSVAEALRTLAELTDSSTDRPVNKASSGPVDATSDMLLRCSECNGALNDSGECDVCLTDTQQLARLAESDEDRDVPEEL